MILAESCQDGIGFLAGVHVMGDEEEAGFRGFESECLIVLILGLEGFDFLAFFIGFGEKAG